MRRQAHPHATTLRVVTQSPQATKPPAGHTGALRTYQPVKQPQILVDYVAYTLHSDEEDPYQAVPFVCPDEWTAMPSGFDGYKCQLRYGHIRVGFNPIDERADYPVTGIHVDISGQGCRELEGKGLRDWPGFIQWGLGQGAHFTRLDLALDDHTGLLEYSELQAAILAGHYTSPSEKGRAIESWEKKGGERSPTIYIGSPTSDTQVRVYDKAKEQAVAGHWIRVELQCRRKRANLLASLLGKEGARQAVGVIRRYLDIKQPNKGDSNVRRWQTVGWWATFLDQASKVALGVSPVVRTLEKAKAWLQRQVAPTLAMVVECAAGDASVLYDLVGLGRYRLQPYQRAIVACKVLAT